MGAYNEFYNLRTESEEVDEIRIKAKRILRKLDNQRKKFGDEIYGGLTSILDDINFQDESGKSSVLNFVKEIQAREMEAKKAKLSNLSTKNSPMKRGLKKGGEENKEENKDAVEAVAEADEKKVAVEFSEEGLVEDEDEEMEKIVDSTGSVSLEEKKEHNRGAGMAERRKKNAEGHLIDLYVTQKKDILFVLSKAEEAREKAGRNLVIYDPCAGEGAIVNLFREKGFEIEERDLHFGANRADFTGKETKHPVFFDVMVFNPPFSKKVAFLEKALELGRPFAILLPFETYSQVGVSKLLKDAHVQAGVLVPAPFFCHEGKLKRYGPCVWFFINWEVSQNDLFYIFTD